eukprot:6204760-Pleurochrysis_carterae.AAC.2
MTRGAVLENRAGSGKFTEPSQKVLGRVAERSCKGRGTTSEGSRNDLERVAEACRDAATSAAAGLRLRGVEVFAPAARGHNSVSAPAVKPSGGPGARSSATDAAVHRPAVRGGAGAPTAAACDCACARESECESGRARRSQRVTAR